MNAGNNTEMIQSDVDAKRAGYTDGKLWLKKIEKARGEEQDWRQEAADAIKVYEADKTASVTFNLFYSNVETIIPALYNSQPVPDVRRRFGDPDPVAKQVVDMTERALSYSQDQYDIDAAMVGMIRDGEVAGRGAIRLRYVAHDRGYQEVYVEQVPWDKIIIGPARTWEKVPWVAFEHDLTKDELRKLNAGKARALDMGEIADKAGRSSEAVSKDPSGVLKTQRMYEIWDKASRTVLFVDDKKEIWEEIDDPLGLEAFFPCFKPFQPALRVSGLTPICPFTVYKPLFDELDAVTKRISRLIKQLRVRGLIDGEMQGDFEQLKECEDGQYVAAQNVATFAQAGGLEKAIAHWPMDPTVKALQQLYVQRDAIKQTIYEVTGIADILRGASDPRETLGAQQIKQQWGSLRIQMLQKQVAEIARQIYRSKVEIFARHFSDQNLGLMTSLPMTQEQQKMWPQVLQLFRSDMRSFKIDIETDSTVRADMTRNQEQMNQFLAGTGQFATAMAGVVQGMPQFAQGAMPVMIEVYGAFARKFKLGKQAEDALDTLSQRVQEMAQQPQQEQPDPEAEKAKMEMQAMQARAQLEAQGLQQKAAHEERLAQLAERKAMLDIEVKQMELQMKREQMALDAQVKRQDMEFRAAERQEEFAFGQAERRANAQMQREANDIKREGMADKQKFERQRMQQAKARPEARA